MLGVVIIHKLKIKIKYNQSVHNLNKWLQWLLYFNKLALKIYQIHKNYYYIYCSNNSASKCIILHLHLSYFIYYTFTK